MRGLDESSPGRPTPRTASRVGSGSGDSSAKLERLSHAAIVATSARRVGQGLRVFW